MEERFTGKDALLAGVLAVLVLFTWLPRLKGPIDLRWDAAGNYILGKSLAQSKGYRLLNEPGEIHSIQDPPLLPSIVAIAIKLLGTDDPLVAGHWLRILYLFLHVALILLTYFFARKFLPPLYAFFTGIILILSTALIFISDVFYAEIPFTVIVVLFFLLSYRTSRPLGSTGQYILAVLSFLLRTAGAALLAAWVVESLFRKQFRITLIRLVAVSVPILLWFGYVAHVKSGPEFSHPAYSYQRAGYLYQNTDYATYVRLKAPLRLESQTESAAETFQRFRANVQKLPAKVFSTMAVDYSNLEQLFKRVPLPSFFPKKTDYYIPYTLGLLALCGLAFPIAKRQWTLVLFLLFFLPPVFIWPFTDEMYRLLIPVTPIFAIAFVRMLFFFKEILTKRFGVWSHAPAFAILLAVFLLQGVVVSQLYRFSHQEVNGVKNGQPFRFRWFYYDPAQSALDQALEWFKENGDRSRVVVAMSTDHVYLRTGMKTVKPPFTSDVAKAEKLLESIPAGYLLLDDTHPKLTIEFTAPPVGEYPDQWKPVYAAPKDVQQGVHEYQKHAHWREDNVPLDVPSIYERVASGGLMAFLRSR